MPNSELDKLINVSEELSAARSVKAISYRVNGDELILTVIKRTKQDLYLPSQQTFDDNPSLLEDDVFLSEDQVSDHILYDGYEEGDFQEYGGVVLYSVTQEKASVKAIAELAYQHLSSHPYSSLKPNLSELLYSKLPASENLGFGGYIFADSDEQILHWAEQDGLDAKSLKAVKAFLESNRTAVASLLDFTKNQEPAKTMFLVTKSGNKIQRYNENGEILTGDVFRAVCELPGMEPVAQMIEKGVTWGVRYDAKRAVLQCTLNGKDYMDRACSVHVEPEDLSLILSGLSPHSEREPYHFLFTEQGRTYSESIAKTLPDPQEVFDKKVDKYLKKYALGSEDAWDLVTDGNKPFGLYFKIGGKKTGFIPLDEFLSNEKVFHILPLTGTNMLDGSYKYDCYAELVKDGDHYAYMLGHEGDIDKEEDCIKYYPDIVTAVTIKDNKVVKTALFEGKCHGPSACGGYYGTVFENSDVPNARFDSAKTIESSVMAAAIFQWRDFVRQNFGLSAS